MAALQRVSEFLPDLSGLIPERLKPYAKFVVVVVLGLIYLLVTQTVIDDSTGREWAGVVLFVASALGVAGTTNESTDDDPPPDDAILSDGEDVVDPSGELGYEPDPDAPDDTYEPPPQEEVDISEPPVEPIPDHKPEDESVKGPGEEPPAPSQR